MQIIKNLQAKSKVWFQKFQLNRKFQIETLIAPEKAPHMEKEAKWLGGRGAGSWFFLRKLYDNKPNSFQIKRYNPSGILEFDRIFELEENSGFEPNLDYEFTYVSHGAMVSILQNNKLHKFYFQQSRENFLLQENS